MVVNSKDFENGALKDFGVKISYESVTISFTGNGDEIRDYTTSVMIDAIFHKELAKYKQNEAGLQKTRDAYIMVKPDQSMKRGDRITYKGEKFIVFAVNTYAPAGKIEFYKYADLTLAEGEVDGT